MRYYMFMSEEDNPFGTYYPEGLNQISVPFDPHQYAEEAGGFKFAREDILAFLGYGPWIREVTIPEDAQVYEYPKSPDEPEAPRTWSADKVILGPRRRITPTIIRELIVEGADVNASQGTAL